MPQPRSARRARPGPAGSPSPGPVGLTTATARAVLGVPISAARADRVAEQLARAIELGLVLDGERLPPESELAEELGTATVTLREALATLRERGLVETRRGRGGGTFVRRLPDASTGLATGVNPLLRERLGQLSIQELREIGDHRQAISGTCAALAARRADEHDMARLRQRLVILEQAGTVSERRRADTQFTLEVAAAAQSSRLAREELSLHARLGDLLWSGSDDIHHGWAVAARRQLVSAISTRRERRARESVAAAIEQDTARLIGQRIDLYREGPR